MNGANPAVAANWNDLCASYRWRRQASVSPNIGSPDISSRDIGSLLHSIVQALTAAIGIAGKVIAIVA